MPIYRFRCPECIEEEEALIPMVNRNDPRLHSCGAVMERLMTTSSVTIFKICGRDKVLNTLNAEAQRPFVNGTPVRSNRSTAALAKGLDQTRPVIGRGI